MSTGYEPGLVLVYAPNCCCSVSGYDKSQSLYQRQRQRLRQDDEYGQIGHRYLSTYTSLPIATATATKKRKG